MTTTPTEIKTWLQVGKWPRPHTHMIVVCDTFDNNDYPVYVSSSEDINERLKELNADSKTRVIEVYNYDLDLDRQLGEQRAWHL